MRTQTGWRIGFLLALAYATPSLAIGTPLPRTLPTHLTPGEQARQSLDETKYPHLMRYLGSIDLVSRAVPADPKNGQWIKTSHVFEPTLADWKGFWAAAAADHLTCLRAFGLLSRKIKQSGAVMYGPGSTFEHGVSDNHVDLGLALPARNVGMGIWSPDPAIADPEFQLHLKVWYTQAYIHQFPDEILPANLKIGFSDPAQYWLEGRAYNQPSIDADIYYGPTNGIGFRNVKGVGGQKRGFLGFMQKVFFFLPDGISSMIIREDKDSLVTEAMINTVVPEFEKNPIYAIKVPN